MRSSLAERCFVAIFKRPNQSFLKDSRLRSDSSQAIRECNPSSSEVVGNMVENPIEWNLCGGIAVFTGVDRVLPGGSRLHQP